MAQNNYIDELIKRQGHAINHDVKILKKNSRSSAIVRKLSRKLTGHAAKMFIKKRRANNIEKNKKREIKEQKNIVSVSSEPLPAFLLDRNIAVKSKELAKTVRSKTKEHSVKYAVPIPRVAGVSEKEAFKSITTGSKGKCHWKRMVTKPCFVGDNFTRKPPKYERFIRPMALRYKKAHVVHPELNSTSYLPILGIKKNPHSELYTNLGILSKGAVIEVNVSELGLVDSSGRIIWGKYAQVTNNPENDGCVNAVLLV